MNVDDTPSVSLSASESVPSDSPHLQRVIEKTNPFRGDADCEDDRSHNGGKRVRFAETAEIHIIPTPTGQAATDANRNIPISSEKTEDEEVTLRQSTVHSEEDVTPRGSEPVDKGPAEREVIVIDDDDSDEESNTNGNEMDVDSKEEVLHLCTFYFCV